MKRELQLKINGESYEFLVEPRTLLLDVIRDKAGLTGTKEGCSTGMCGACTVLVDGLAVKSCLILALQCQGKEITTIEGLTEGDQLDPVQESFVEHGAIQCGFCTPGMILNAKAFLQEHAEPTEEDIRFAISGNLCRCTGYVKIIEAIKAASGKR